MAEKMIDLCGTDVPLGNLVLLEVQNQKTSLWHPLAYQRGGTLNRNGATIDISSKEDFGWGNSIQGVKTWGFDTDGMYIENHEGFDLLEDAFNLGHCLRVRLRFPSGKIYMGLCIITDFPLDVPYDNAVTYTVTLQGKGVLETDRIAPTVQATSVVISGYEKALKVGEFVQLKAKVLPENASQEVKWLSYSNNFATVDETGKVTAVAVGEAHIRARALGSAIAVGAQMVEVVAK